jgi:DNA-binding transcriptional LysR family regulator
MSELQEIRVFVKLVEANSSTKAADQMGVAISAISRRMKDLESRLGVQLVQRTTRRMNLTEDGKFFYQRCRRLLDDLDEATMEVSRSAKSLKGVIKLSTPLSFGVSHLSPVIAKFMQSHQQIEMSLDMTDRRVDLLEEGVDLAIRIGELDDSSLVARKLAPIRHVVCCSPSLLEKHGPIHQPSDLINIPALCYANLKTPSRWHYQDHEGKPGSLKMTPRMLSTNGDAIRDAAIAGVGVVCEPTFIIHKAIEQGQLIPVLENYIWHKMNLYAVYPNTRNLSTRVRTFIDYMVESFGDKPYWDDCLGVK